jgi:hypothetical protein
MRTSILNPQDIDHFALEALTWFLLIISRRLFYTFHSRGLRCLTVNCRCYRSNEKPEVWFANEYRNVKTKLTVADTIKGTYDHIFPGKLYFTLLLQPDTKPRFEVCSRTLVELSASNRG